MITIENGGAVAIKGFNYQKAAIIHVMINNYEKENFKIVPESKEDFEVHIDSDVYYIQVKGTKKLSLSKLIQKTKNKKTVDLSIIEKNLSPGKNNDRRNIFLYDLIDSDRSGLDREVGTIVDPIYSFSDEQKKLVVEKLKLNASQKLRLDNQKIFITPFKNDLHIAATMLKGEMVSRDLLVTNDRANLVLSTLAWEIDKKSEISVTSEFDENRKIIDGDFLNEVFVSVRQKELFDEILENLPYNAIKKRKIKSEKTKIIIIYQSLKKELKKNVDKDELLNMTEKEVIDFFSKKLKKIDSTIDNDELSIALSIDCFCELGGDF